MSDAASRLRELTEPPSVSIAEIARRCGVSREAARQWALGHAKPGAASRKIIEMVLGIPESDWLTEKERAALEKAGDTNTNGDAAA